MSWKINFRGNHTETALLLFYALKRKYPNCHFITEAAIHIGDGGYIADFLFKEVNMVVEVDGKEVHDSSPIQRAKTQRKKKALIAAGYEYLSFTNGEVKKDADYVADLICVRYLEIEAKQSSKRVEYLLNYYNVS